MLRILGNLLRQLGFTNVSEAEDGEDALRELKRDKYNLVISDCNMQRMSGLDLLRKVRGDQELRHLPFIMVTAESKTETVIAAKNAGVSNYIVKPFNAETLKKKLVTVLGPF